MIGKRILRKREVLERLGIRKMKTAPIVTVRQINGSI
jgi:hypothetical protein